MTTSVRVGYCRNLPPYQFEDQEGNATGFHVELLNEVAEDSGLLLEYCGFESTSEALAAMEKGDIDIVLGVTEDQVLGINVQNTLIISSANVCLLADRETGERYRNGDRRLKIAVEYKIINPSFISPITQNNVLITKNQKDSLDAEQLGDVDLIVGIKECLLWYLEKEELSDNYDILINYINSADYTIAVRAGDRYLKDELDNGIRKTRTDGTYGKIYDSWFYIDDGTRYLRILRYVGIGAAILAITLLAYYIISRKTQQKLEAMVEERTGELNLANVELEKKNYEIREENELRQAIIESSPASTFVFDRSFDLRYLNRNAKDLILACGMEDPASVLEIPVLASILKDVGLDLFEKEWMSRSGTLEKRDSVGDIEEKYRYSCHKINRTGSYPEALLSVEDITVEDREREALFEKRKNTTLNQLIVGIAHEIKNPLTAINTSVEMMQKKGNNEKYWKAFSTYIPAEVERITKLINNLVGYARPTAGESEPVELTELLQSAYELASISAKGVIVQLELNGLRNIFVRCDRDRIKQSLMNVIFNGIESGQKQASADKLTHHVMISLRTEENCAVIEIRDDGVGMTEEEMKRCTEPFYTTKPTGTGIGLAVTKQYLDEMGGSMSLTSEKNRYTLVCIKLPLMKEQENEYEAGNSDRR